MVSWQAVGLRGAYYARQAGWLVGALALHRAFPVARRPDPASLPDDLVEAVTRLRARYRRLLRDDVRDAEAGWYPARLLVQPTPPRDAVRLPELLADHARIARRRETNRWRDLPERVDLERFPPYYRRTFHWQTDGYLSERSARRYDIGVDLLFLGAADAMRRRVLPPIVAAARRVAQREGRPARVLDVACGTGRTLTQLRAALPDAELTGVDLSPWYLRAARERLGTDPRLTLREAPAEELPFDDGAFDVVTSTWLFHELPPVVRARAATELVRATCPGGAIVVADSMQSVDDPVIAPLLRWFPRDFHEPWYDGYLDDPLEGRLAAAGAPPGPPRPAYLSKVVVARVPHR